MIASAYLQFTLVIIFQNRAETRFYLCVHFKHMVIMTTSIKMSQTHISFFDNFIIPIGYNSLLMKQ